MPRKPQPVATGHWSAALPRLLTSEFLYRMVRANSLEATRLVMGARLSLETFTGTYRVDSDCRSICNPTGGIAVE